MFHTWGRLVYRFRWPVLLGALALVAASVFAITQLGTSLSNDEGADRRLEAVRVTDLTRAELPSGQVGAGFNLIFTPNDPALGATDPALAGAVEAALAPLRDDPRVARIDGGGPPFASRDGRRVFATVTLRARGDEAARQYEELRAKVVSPSFAILATGLLPINKDFNEVLEADLLRAELFGLPLALAVLIGVFGMVLWRPLRRSALRGAGLTLALAGGALALALVPLLIGGFTIAGGVAGIYALAQRREMSVYALNIASMIGLGLAIDYSLFIISRFLEEVPHRPVPDALARTVATTGKAIAFSGLTVAIGVAGLLFYHSTMLTSMGLAAMLVVSIAVWPIEVSIVEW
jgi:RND superfamily putative drug exporter